MIQPKASVLTSLENFESCPDPKLVVDDHFLDAIFFYNINLLDYPVFHQLYLEFLRSVL